MAFDGAGFGILLLNGRLPVELLFTRYVVVP
jgi:hypothetical protein